MWNLRRKQNWRWMKKGKSAPKDSSHAESNETTFTSTHFHWWLASRSCSRSHSFIVGNDFFFAFLFASCALFSCWFENISSIISFYVIFGFWRQLKATHSRRWKSDIVQPALRLILIFLRECVQHSGGSSVKSRRIMISSNMEMRAFPLSLDRSRCHR